jgi:hypothetical protein
MPRIELIDVPLFQPEDPYHYEFDNLPLKALKTRQELINMALDNLIYQMRDAIGTQNTVANRLNQSIDADGNLKASAIDEALHSIEEHEDTDDYVRMTSDERAKLENIASDATSLTLTYDDTEFDSGTVVLADSSSITIEHVAPNIIKWNLAFDTASAHQHYYGLTPVDATSTADYTNYKVNTSSTEYIDGSLKVYVNGVRIYEDAEIYVPGVLVDDPWTLLKFTSDAEAGTFALSSPLTEDDIIRIDFDVSFI